MSYAYDELARIKERTLNLTSPFKSSVNYLSGASPNTTTAMVERLQNGNDILSYTYDDLGNIETISENGELKVTYTYDELSQLVREDNLYQNQTITYTYDTGGNILSVSEYAYTTGELGEVVAVKTYGYEDANWKDKLTSYNGQTITYDEIGNPLQYRDGMNFTWQNGRQLASINDNITYQYNDGGIRTQKTVNGVTTNYYLNGSTILSQVTGSDQMDFYYDDTGNLFGFSLNGASYYYVKNLQNDIIGILDSDGSQVVSYVYDSWGRLISTTGSLAETVGVQNPFRYRGYYYDVESEMYYLNSRYYDPEMGRFINADVQLNTQLGPLGLNLYAYCVNNPTNMYDNRGNRPEYIVRQSPNEIILINYRKVKMKDIKWGTAGNIADNGCGVIAVFNVLISKSQKVDFSSVISGLTLHNGPLMFGLLGVSPVAIVSYLKSYFASVSAIGPPISFWPSFALRGYVVIVLYKNPKSLSMHYVAGVSVFPPTNASIRTGYYEFKNCPYVDADERMTMKQFLDTIKIRGCEPIMLIRARWW